MGNKAYDEMCIESVWVDALSCTHKKYVMKTLKRQ